MITSRITHWHASARTAKLRGRILGVVLAGAAALQLVIPMTTTAATRSDIGVSAHQTLADHDSRGVLGHGGGFVEFRATDTPQPGAARLRAGLSSPAPLVGDLMVRTPDPPTPSTPLALLLFGSGLVGLCLLRRRRHQKSAVGDGAALCPTNVSSYLADSASR